MSLRKQYKVNADVAENGAPFYCPPNDDGTIPVIYIRRIGANDGAYNKVVERIMAPHRRAQEVGALPQDQHDALAREIFAEGAIARWENVLLADVMDDDALTGFADSNKENHLRLLEALPELHAELRTFAVMRNNYLAANVEADAKNS